MRIKTSSKAKFYQIIEQEDALYLFNAIAEIHTNGLIGYKFLCNKIDWNILHFLKPQNKK